MNVLSFTGKWQGRLDSNQRMARSKPAALPLGDAPKMDDCIDGRGGWIRTNGWRDQNPLPYHLATPLIQTSTGKIDGRGGWIRTNGWRDQNPLPYHLATPLSIYFQLTQWRLI